MAQAYKTPLTVLAGQVPSTQTNFPATVYLNDTRFKTIANGGHVANASGYDIRFYSDSALTTALTYERVTYSASGGTGEFHVMISSMADGVVIYVGYGDSALSSDGSSSSTWPSEYKLVLHLGDGSTVSSTDSTSNGNNFTQNGSPTALAGKIGGGMSLNGSTQSLYKATGITGFTGNYTFSFWAQPANLDTGFLFDCNTGRLVLNFGDSAPTAGAPSFYDGTWRSIGSTLTEHSVYHVVYTLNSSGTGTVYINGSSYGTAAYSTVTGIADELSIGAHYDSSSAFKSMDMLDEFRIANTVKTANWVTTEYNNQNAPNTFWTMGTEVAVGGGQTLHPMSLL